MKDTICKYCNSVNKHFSFQCRLKPKKNTKSKVKKPIAKFSDKKLSELKEYRKKRDIFLKQNNKCEFPGCESTDITCHHSEGRIGANLTDVSKFKALCWPHHKYCEENPLEAKKLGLSKDRL